MSVQMTGLDLSETERHRTSRGRSHPLGARPDDGGVNFAVFSEHATAMQLLLFEHHDSPAPYQIITLDPETNRTFAVWHVRVEGLRAPAFYGLRAFGPEDVPGLRFDPDKVLLDPYARGVDRALWDRGAACRPGDNTAVSLRSVVVDTDGYDWEGDEPLRRTMDDLIIYEAHVGGFTRSPSSGVGRPGTFAGLVEKIPHLTKLGVNAVELLPVFDFDDGEANFWGYSTAAYFAPHAGYCVAPDEGGHLREFRDMVKALHAAGIEVILDVVFNHTDEGNHLGPLFAFAGLDNPNYYYLDPNDRRHYYDYSGCGNTLMANHPIVTKMIVECLEFWVREMHVDGFRFDEAAVLTRGARGEVLDEPPVVWQIELSDTLADTKIIAEAWDAAGAYEVGRYPGYRWAEWNGRYRDTMRRFVRGEPGIVGDVAERLTGSADLYQARGHRPINSVNFITCHDGFTLADLVSYDEKHNEANGEGNRDGNDDNMSWNCGAEGPTTDPEVKALRVRQIKNFAALLLLSRGVPMMLGGDEIGRTQQGNNNAYRQDNEISWLDWSLVDDHAEVLSFWQRMIAFRKAHPSLRQPTYEGPEIAWHGTRLGRPGWTDPDARTLACTIDDLHIIANMYWAPLDFELPAVPGRVWARAVDTSSPDDAETFVDTATISAPGRSVIVLISRPS